MLWYVTLFIISLHFQVLAVDGEIRGELYALSSPIVRQFTSYALKHHIYEEDFKESSCPVEVTKNVTEILFESTIDRCVYMKYYPRHLYPKQVSWRRTKGHGQYPKSSNGKFWNGTLSSGAHDEDHETEGKIYESDEIVSEFLAFALLLPGHPFSSDLYLSIVTVAPMYPRVIFVIGNANEFTELCAQYGVRSFPKLLFFNKVKKMKSLLFIKFYKLLHPLFSTNRAP